MGILLWKRESNELISNQKNKKGVKHISTFI